MNYHKKLLSIGFKKSKEALVVVQRRESWRIVAYDIVPLSEIGERSPPHEMRIDTKSPFLETYVWKVSESITIYLTTSKFDYCCFVEDKDSDITDNINVYDGQITEKNHVLIVQNDRFNPIFWKQIMYDLPLQIKREVALKQIF